MSAVFNAFTDMSEHLFGPPAAGSLVEKMKGKDAPDPPLVDPSQVNPNTEQLAASGVANSIPAVDNSAPPQTPPPQQATPVAEPQPIVPQQAPVAMPILQQQTNFTSGKKVDPALQTAESNAMLAVDKSVQAKAEVEAETYKNQALVLQNEAANQARILQEGQAEQAKIKAETDKRIQLFDAASEERKSFKMNPNRYWDTMPAGSKIASVIGMALGAFGSALARTPNYAQQMIDNAINRDIQAQQLEYQKLGDDVDAAKNGYAFFRQKGLDAAAATTAQRISSLEASQAKAAAIAASSKSPEIKANAEIFSKQTEQKIIDEKIKYSLVAQGQAVTQTVRGMPQGQSMADQLHLRELEVNVPQADGSSKVYLAKSGKSADDIRKAQTVAKSVKSNLLEMKKLIAETSQSVSPSAKAQVETLADQLRTQFAVLNNLGALSDKDYSIASQLGNPTSILQRDSTTMKLIDDWHGRIDKDMMSHYESQGLIGTNTVGK